jgi:hypothetical protein
MIQININTNTRILSISRTPNSRKKKLRFFHEVESLLNNCFIFGHLELIRLESDIEIFLHWPEEEKVY